MLYNSQFVCVCIIWFLSLKTNEVISVSGMLLRLMDVVLKWYAVTIYGCSFEHFMTLSVLDVVLINFVFFLT